MNKQKITYARLASRIEVGMDTIQNFIQEKNGKRLNPNGSIDESIAETILSKFAPKLSIKLIKEEFQKNSEKQKTELKEQTKLKSESSKKDLVSKNEKNTPNQETESPFSTVGHINLDPKSKKAQKVQNSESEKLIKKTPLSQKKETKANVVGNINDRKKEAEKKAPKNTEDILEKETEKVSPVTENTIYKPSEPQQIAVKKIGQVDLKSINPSKKSSEKRDKNGRRKRNHQVVDLDKEGKKIAETSRKKTKNESSTSRNKQQKDPKNKEGNSSNVNGRKKKRQNTIQKVERSEEDTQKQVKETLALLQNRDKFGKNAAKARKERREAHRIAAEEALEAGEREKRILKLTEFVTVNDLANMMDVSVNEVISTCMAIDMMVSINMRLDADTLKMVAEEFGFETEFISSDIVESINESEENDNEEDIINRAPIVTVLGHVDHGKTSLLDSIRSSNVIAGEAGGITQHIGSYSVTIESGKQITFLDTPGHEAFTAMRARGAKATDIAIIIIAANEGIKPQTTEAINHAAAAGVPIIFALNKIDVAGANPDKIKEQLAAINYLVEDWGGKYQCQEISAKKGIGINELLEKVLLEAEILDLKANPKKRASGVIIESSLDKGRGYLSNILVQNGTLEVGDIILAGQYYGRVKAMTNERKQKLSKAGPSTPAMILGFNGAPSAGDQFHVLETEAEARELANKRIQLAREQTLRTNKMLTLDDIGKRIAVGNFQELNLIVKGDVDGSVEALSDSLIRLSTEEVLVRTIHKGVGQISESDIVLAEASNAIVIGFEVRPNAIARKKAEQAGIEIRTYSVIYDAIDDLKNAIEGMLSPDIKEQNTALLEVQQIFTIGKIGTIAGCLVQEGKIHKTDKVRVIRDGIVIFTGVLESLKRFKDDVKEVAFGLDCGLNIKGFNDLREGDTIEGFQEIEVKKKL